MPKAHVQMPEEEETPRKGAGKEILTPRHVKDGDDGFNSAR
jgi:hypothetical protein